MDWRGRLRDLLVGEGRFMLYLGIAMSSVIGEEGLYKVKDLG